MTNASGAKPTAPRRPDEAIEERNVLTHSEEEKVVDRLKMRAPAVYATIKEQGEAELLRPTRSLFFSGIVAGIAMGFSILTLALLQMHLPPAPWTALISSFGYAAGFLIVILGSQQLFTENTITVVLPLTRHPTWRCLLDLCRVWGTVLVANWIGCILIAGALVGIPLVGDETARAVVAASQHYAHLGAGEAFRLGIGAGFIVAAMVWMTPGAKEAEFVLIVFAAWLIALAGFTHVVAGMVEVAVVVIDGQLSPVSAFLTIVLPTLAGNVVGGTLLFTAFAYAQVHDEVAEG